LHEQNRFDRRFPVSTQESIDKFLIECARVNFGRIALPPIRFIGTVMKPNAAELARVGEDKRAFRLK
jgi:hypothetical protein